MNIKHLKAAAIAGVATLVLSACSQAPASRGYQEPPVWASHVSYSGMWLDIEDVRDYRSPEKGLKVVAQLRSAARTDKAFAYRVLWFTADGQPIKTVLGKWQDRSIKPGQIVELIEVGPGPRAQDYRFEFMDK